MDKNARFVDAVGVGDVTEQSVVHAVRGLVRGLGHFSDPQEQPQQHAVEGGTHAPMLKAFRAACKAVEKPHREAISLFSQLLEQAGGEEMPFVFKGMCNALETVVGQRGLADHLPYMMQAVLKQHVQTSCSLQHGIGASSITDAVRRGQERYENARSGHQPR